MIEIIKFNFCFQTKDASDAEELTMDNLKGIFLVLVIGSIFASLYGCVEATVIMYRRAKKEKV